MIIKCTKQEMERIMNNDRICVGDLMDEDCVVGLACSKCKERNITFEITEQDSPVDEEKSHSMEVVTYHLTGLTEQQFLTLSALLDSLKSGRILSTEEAHTIDKAINNLYITVNVTEDK